jgi:hypothetical protein
MKCKLWIRPMLSGSSKWLKFLKYGTEILFPKIHVKIILQKNFYGHWKCHSIPEYLLGPFTKRLVSPCYSPEPGILSAREDSVWNWHLSNFIYSIKYDFGTLSRRSRFKNSWPYSNKPMLPIKIQIGVRGKLEKLGFCWIATTEK